MEPEPPLVDPTPPEVPAVPPVERWRKVLWSLFAIGVIFPPVWVAGFFATGFLFSWLDSWWSTRDSMLLWVPLIASLLAAGWLVRSGLRRGWPGRRAQLIGWGTAAGVIFFGFLALAVGALSTVRNSSKQKAMIPRQAASAVDQFFIENPHRIFLRYDELVGPDRYLRAYNAADGEDLSFQFPVRQGCGESLSVRLPDGTTVRRIEVIAAVGQSGLVATFPLPQDDQYDPKRVYRLDNGVTFRDWRVVDRPPDPAGREGRDQDGVHVYQLSGGRRFEITYRGGVPDGPFRAFHGDGAPWGEATYRNGRVVEAWLFTRDGRKFDELKDGEAAQKALNESLAAASSGARESGLQKLAAKDYAGAIADFTRALTINPLDADLHRARGDAYRATGNLDEAINDWCAAEGYTPEQAASTIVSDRLRDAFMERGRQRQQQGDETGATRDFQVVTQTAFWRAEEFLRNRDFSGALAALDPAIALAAVAELHDLRADAERGLQRLEGAEADYSRALELVTAGKMRLPANQRIMAAQVHYKRGHLRRWLGRLPEAAADFRAALPQLGTGGLVNQSDAALWLFLTQCEAGQRNAAVRELQATPRADWWPAGQQTARYLLGEITEAELDAAVAKSNQAGDRLIAELLSGLLRRQAGDEAGALPRLRQAARRTSHDELTMQAAQREAGQALRAQAEHALAGGDFATATATLKEAVALSRPAPAGLLARYGDARRGAKDPEGALATYHESLQAVVTGTEAALATELREKIAAVNAELKPIRQARADAQKATRAAARQPAPGTPSTGTLMVEARNRAAQKLRTGDYAGAAADYTQAIELLPDAMNHASRASARRKGGDLAGAIADYTKLIQLEPQTWMHRFTRGHLRRANHDLPGAAEDIRATVEACLKINPLNNSASRAAFWLYQVECERGRPAEAAAELAQTFADMERAAPGKNPSYADFFAWDRQVADLILGRLTEEQLLASLAKVDARSRNDRQFKALFFSALKRRQSGDEPGAGELFRQALALPNAQYFEWESAEARRAVPPVTP